MARPRPVPASAPKVLIVDDIRWICEAWGRALARAGFVVESALTESDAIQRIRHDHYDLAFVDIILSDRAGDRGGLRVIAELLRTKFGTKVIAISGSPDIAVAVEAFRLGVFDYLQKGMDSVDQIVAAANRAMEEGAPLPNRTPAPPMREEFERLAAAWRAETQFSSSASEMFMNKNYQAIIGQGIAIVPFILEDLKKGPDHWYWALGAITGANPAAGAAPGDIAAMSAAWLEWGKRKGILR